jgi:hypothetical protein
VATARARLPAFSSAQLAFFGNGSQETDFKKRSCFRNRVVVRRVRKFGQACRFARFAARSSLRTLQGAKWIQNSRQFRQHGGPSLFTEACFLVGEMPSEVRQTEALRDACASDGRRRTAFQQCGRACLRAGHRLRFPRSVPRSLRSARLLPSLAVTVAPTTVARSDGT